MDRHIPHSAVFRRFHPQDDEEPHLYQRSAQHGLMVRLGQTLAEIDDISVEGVCLDGLHGEPGAAVELQLIPRDGKQLQILDALWAKGQIVDHVHGFTRIRFSRMTFGLAKFFIKRLARQNEVSPYIFK